MIEKLSLRERQALEAMAACQYQFELIERLGSGIGWYTVEQLCARDFAVGGFCPMRPESHGWAITELGRRVLAAHQARQPGTRLLQTLAFTAEQCRTGRELLAWTQLDLAVRARCTVASVQRFETEGKISKIHIRDALRQALERGGIEIRGEGGADIRPREAVS